MPHKGSLMAPLYPLIGVLRCCVAITCFSCLTRTGRGWQLRSNSTSESEYCSMLEEKWGRPKKHGNVHMVCCSPSPLPQETCTDCCNLYVKKAKDCDAQLQGQRTCRRHLCCQSSSRERGVKSCSMPSRKGQHAAQLSLRRNISRACEAEMLTALPKTWSHLQERHKHPTCR